MYIYNIIYMCIALDEMNSAQVSAKQLLDILLTFKGALQLLSNRHM